MKTPASIIATTLLASLLCVGIAPAAFGAEQNPSTDQIDEGALTELPGAEAIRASGDTDLSLAVMVDGELTPVDELIDIQSLDLNGSEPSVGEVTPQLINLDQWTRCYVFDELDSVFASYIFYWNGAGKDVRLKCGTSGWGYKHIQAEHQDDWQAKYDNAVAQGWNPSLQGIQSWDDLMNVVVSTITMYPDYVGSNSINQTQCGVTMVYFIQTSTGLPAYQFRSRAAWATNSDRLITAFPTGSLVC
ncbi:hypothetical protein [Microbacterium sp. 18062]|uniref:hypothetical protein n=1 Tax=Microbacterium sp. 18062 TaxID=2681410 RepID=UPI001356F02E|nr:hypothetical protein [Microbacterium sp. 18062]